MNKLHFGLFCLGIITVAILLGIALSYLVSFFDGNWPKYSIKMYITRGKLRYKNHFILIIDYKGEKGIVCASRNYQDIKYSFKYYTEQKWPLKKIKTIYMYKEGSWEWLQYFAL